MKSKKRIYLSSLVMIVFIFGFVQTALTQEEKTASGKLAVLWTSGDPDVAHNVAFMYAHTAKKVGWFGEVTLIVWGPSQRLLAGDASSLIRERTRVDDHHSQRSRRPQHRRVGRTV